MVLVAVALVLWLAFNFLVVFADVVLVVRDERAARRDGIPLSHHRLET